MSHTIISWKDLNAKNQLFSERYSDPETWLIVEIDYPQDILDELKKYSMPIKQLDEIAFLRWIAYFVDKEDLEIWFNVLRNDLKEILLQNWTSLISWTSSKVNKIL